MVELHFSFMAHSPAADQALIELLKQFETEARLKLLVRSIPWATARADLNRTAFERAGLDVSQIGTTWVGDLYAMDALRSFSPLEVSSLGGQDAFVPASWMPGKMPDDERLWSAPWLGDAYVIHYRRDVLIEAGLDPQTAFASTEALENTVLRLSEHGHPFPIAPALNFDPYGILHCSAPFVWNEGGAFVSPDGKKLLFNQPEALRGLTRYFKLLEHYSPQALHTLYETNGWNMFLQGDAAIALGAQGLARQGDPAPQVVENWGIVPIPPTSFIGGSNLVVWRHTRHEIASLELVRFLTSHAIQLRVSQILGTLPVRKTALTDEQFLQHPLQAQINRALQTGRTYVPVPLWGMIEDRLVHALQQVWQSYCQDPTQEILSILHQHITPLSQLLSITLSQYNSRISGR